MGTAQVVIDPRLTTGAVNRRLFGSFVEHLGRSVYQGLYEPGHPPADSNGFRKDVLDLVRELGVSTVRYPGGNFVSGYRWEDGVGPRDTRPRRLDLAWHSSETNEVGLDEFAQWCRQADVELMYAVNLGTRGVQEALDVLEYANVQSGTALSDWRIRNGSPEPHEIKMWCLGNEMDGDWQLGHRSASSYGSLASQTAKAMRQMDPTLELVVCGSSNAQMPTFGQWEHTVLSHTYDDVTHISCHAYYQMRDGDLASFLASGVDMDRFIDSVAAAADVVKAARMSDKTISISFDEWNVWYIDRYRDVERITDPQHWPVAPRLLEDVYTVADAVVVGGLLISLLKHAGRVTAASLAQLVNVIAPIMAEPLGRCWRQTTFFPFATTSRLAKGRSLAVTVQAESLPTAQYGDVPVIDAAATHEPHDGRGAIFLVNRHLTEPMSVTVDVGCFGATKVLEAVSLYDDDPSATNSGAHPERVALRANSTAELGGDLLTVTLPPVSWTAVGFK